MPAFSATEQRDTQLPGLALAFAGAIAFSGKAIIVKLAYRYGVDAVMYCSPAKSRKLER